MENILAVKELENQVVSEVCDALCSFLGGAAAHKELQQLSQLPAVLDSMGQYLLAGKVRRCGTWLLFEKYKNKMSGEFACKLAKADMCDHKFCPFCQWRLSRRVLLQLLARIVCLKEKYGADLHFGLLTKTYPNPPVDKVRETYKKMSAAERKFFLNPKIKRRFLGAFTSYEYFGDHTKAGEAHLHSHSLVAFLGDLSERHTQRLCRDVWEHVLDWKNDPLRRGDYHLQVDFRKISEKPGAVVIETEPEVENNKINKNFENICGGVLEVVKYCTAPQAMEKLSEKDFATIIIETKGLRKYRTSGVFYKFKFPEGKNENDYLKMAFDDYKDFDDNKIWEFLHMLSAEWNYYEKKYSVYNNEMKLIGKIGKDLK